MSLLKLDNFCDQQTFDECVMHYETLQANINGKVVFVVLGTAILIYIDESLQDEELYLNGLPFPVIGLHCDESNITRFDVLELQAKAMMFVEHSLTLQHIKGISWDTENKMCFYDE